MPFKTYTKFDENLKLKYKSRVHVVEEKLSITFLAMNLKKKKTMEFKKILKMYVQYNNRNDVNYFLGTSYNFQLQV